MKLEKVVFCPDAHHPYVDKKAWKLFLKCVEEVEPDRLVVLGDFVDLYCTSRHPKDPRRNRDVNWELGMGRKARSELDSFGVKKKTFLLGNHEDNYRRYLEANAPELINVTSVEGELELEENDWEVHQYGELVKMGKIYITHDQDFAGARAHEQTRAAVGHSIVMGHTHRLSVNYASTLVGDMTVAAMFGWLGDPKYATYMKPSKRRDWFHGFGLGYMEPKGIIHLQAIPFIKGKAVIEGKWIC